MNLRANILSLPVVLSAAGFPAGAKAAADEAVAQFLDVCPTAVFAPTKASAVLAQHGFTKIGGDDDQASRVTDYRNPKKATEIQLTESRPDPATSRICDFWIKRALTTYTMANLKHRLEKDARIGALSGDFAPAHGTTRSLEFEGLNGDVTLRFLVTDRTQIQLSYDRTPPQEGSSQ